MFKKKLFSSFLGTFIFLSFNNADLRALGTGDGNSSSPDIPLPAKSYPAVVIEVNNNTIKANRFSVNGKTYFQAMIGEAEVSIPFDKVNSVTIKSQATNIDSNYYNADVLLKDDQILQVLFANDSKLYGEASFGKFELYFRDIKTISLQ